MRKQTQPDRSSERHCPRWQGTSERLRRNLMQQRRKDAPGRVQLVPSHKVLLVAAAQGEGGGKGAVQAGTQDTWGLMGCYPPSEEARRLVHKIAPPPSLRTSHPIGCLCRRDGCVPSVIMQSQTGSHHD